MFPATESRHFPFRTAAALVCAAAFAGVVRLASGSPGGAARALPAVPREARTSEAATGSGGVHIVERGSYPELEVDGKPFFIYSAEFFYPRVPRSLWESSLERYRDLGINTITISIPWNWHEPREGEFDFDGHTNPRRDLRALLRLIAGHGFKLIARPGPGAPREWRNDGYPDWLLAQAEYHMPLADRLEGRGPPAAELAATDAEAAARMWLGNGQHMARVSAWLQAVSHELAPYRPTATVPVARPKSAQEEAQSSPRTVPGPLLFVQVGEGLGSGRANTTGPEFRKYVDALCGDLSRGGLDVRCSIDPALPRAAGARSEHAFAPASLGQWFSRPAAGGTFRREPIGPSEMSTLGLTISTLATQAGFPALLAEFNPHWFAPSDDARPARIAPEEVALAGHLLLAFGVHGLSWYPLQDTLTPAGYGSAAANRFYSWDAPLSLTGERQAGAREVERLGNWMGVWGGWLAASHPRADFGLVDTLASEPAERLTPAEAAAITRTVEQVQRLAQYDSLTSELVDPEFQPPAQLLRHAVLLLPVYKPADAQYALSRTAEDALAAYVRGGGVLVCFPGPPAGAALDALRQGPGVESHSLPEGTREWRAGAGRLVVLTKDFYSWISLEDDFGEAEERFPARFARALLRDVLSDAGARASIRRAENGSGSAELLATELVSDRGTLPLGKRAGGEALLSVVNLSFDTTISETLQVLSPEASARLEERGPRDWISIPVMLPPRESLLLPVDFPLCLPLEAKPDCPDRVISSSAELLRADRDGKLMFLTLYAPVKAEIRLQLAKEPDHIEVDEARADAQWIRHDNEMVVELLRGASPDYRRVVRVPLPYRPALPERPKQDSGRRAPARFRFSPGGAVRLPLGPDFGLLTNPPLFVLNRGSGATLGVVAENLGERGDTFGVEVTGTFNTSARGDAGGGDMRSVKLKIPESTVDKAASGPPAPDGLYHGTLHFSAGADSVDMPAAYAILPATGAAAYRFDFDADGSDEWVLENAAVRAIFSPAAGGRLIALLLKAQEQNLASTMGWMEDSFSSAADSPGGPREGSTDHTVLFNRDYAADWSAGGAGPALRLAYDAPDVPPHGARIEKTVRLSGEREITVEYRVRLLAADAARQKLEAAGQIFGARPEEKEARETPEILNSVPAETEGAGATQICWKLPAAGDSDGAGAERCEAFVRGGPAIPLPAEARSVELRRPRHAGMAMAWDNAEARLIAEPKNSSVLLRLVLPPPQPGGAAVGCRIEFSVKEAR